MKRTSTMKFNETVEARELQLYADNKENVYRYIEVIEQNLLKKVNKGVYSSEKAIDAFYPAMILVSNEYYKEFGYKFSVTDRFSAAVLTVKAFELENNI